MKKLVIILGMRSGTSLTAQISQRMGAYLGEMEELMGAALGNPDGHFENLDVVHMNDNILHFCDREWYSLETPVLDYNSPQMKQAMQEIKEIIQKLFEKSDTVAIKDPRISVLLPIWDKVLNELDIELRYIWVFRNPLEVMESLRKRDGYCSRYVLMLWIHHNLSILKYLQEREYLLINYKDILGQSQALEKLGQVLDRQIDDDLKRELKQIIKQRYCHSEHSYLDVKNTRNKLLSDLYGVLLERQEAEVNVPEWEKRYEEMVTKTEDPFLDYEAMDNIRCLEGKEIVIYGAGNYGRRTAGMLRQLGFLNYNFCDKDIQKQGQNLMDGRVLSVAELENRKNALIIVAIENETSRKEMEQTLAYIDGVSFLSFFALEEAYKYSMGNDQTLMSEAKRLSVWYQTLSGRARNIRNACKSSVLVYQNGKVGSSTVTKSLQKAGIENAHVHRFFFKKDIVGELLLGKEQRDFICTSNFLSFQFPEYIRSVKVEMKGKKIITMVREPIAVDLSTVFQWIGEGTTSRRFAKQIQQGMTFRQVVFELMKEIQNRQFEWFDEELKELSGIDVYSRPFNQEKGYTIISEDNVEILLLKAEKLSNLADVIRDFVGEQRFELLNENVGKNKKYAHLYRRMRTEIELSREYVEYYYHHNPHMDHFYSKEEQKKFLDQWKKNISLE